MRRSIAASAGVPQLTLEGFSTLSNRESQVLSLAAAGYLDKQISAELGVSLNTLRTYWSRVRTKVGEAPRSALAAAYVQSAAEEDLDLPPDWEIEYPSRIMRILSDRPLAIPSERGQEYSLENVLRMVHPDDGPRIRKIIDDVETSSDNVFSYVVRVLVEDGIIVTSAVVKVVRDENGSVVKLLGHRIATYDARTPTIKDIQVGFWNFDLRTQVFTVDEGFGRMFRVDHTAPDVRWQARKRLHKGSETFIQDAVDAKLERTRETHQLVFEKGETLWVTTDLRVEWENGEAVRALGTVMAFH